jgi:V/A-type H+/Na+-transporting ATPase subunit I
VSIEKMLMLNMVGHINDLDGICRDVVLSGCLQPVSALQEIDSTDFTLSATEDNLEPLIDVCFIRPFVSDRDYSIVKRRLSSLREMCPMSKRDRTVYKSLYMDFLKIQILSEELSEEFSNAFMLLKQKELEEGEVAAAIDHLKFLKDLNISLSEVENMKNFTFNLFRITKENVVKLKHNYENVPSVVFSVYRDGEMEIIMTFTPNILKKEADRIFASLNCEKVSLPGKYEGTPADIGKALSKRLEGIRAEKKELEEAFKRLSREKCGKVALLEKSIELEIKCSEIKDNIACTSEFFYLCGWIPESSLKSFKAMLEIYEDRLIIIEKKPEEINESMSPPTKLKNNFLVRPFESMVRMYGIPSYGELDPTTFLGISYMLMFGAMFGDVGQGFVFFLAGLFLKYKQHKDIIGEVLCRLGISSMAFGFLYGSIFGFEHVIKALLIRPMEDIMHILVYAVVFGCGLLIIGFIYNLINSMKHRDLENGVFGKDGIAGLVFYLSVIIFALTKYRGINILPNAVWICCFVILLSMMLFKEPLANLLQNRRPLYHESKKDYFVEGGFGIVETLLSMLSNTLSFIRVGAFALNHVGLFLAFSALAKMMQNNVESILIYILGNVVIIGLEGLIVFIQGLRLEYYELFSKYYEGSGMEFEPVQLTGSEFIGGI